MRLLLRTLTIWSYRAPFRNDPREAPSWVSTGRGGFLLNNLLSFCLLFSLFSSLPPFFVPSFPFPPSLPSFLPFCSPIFRSDQIRSVAQSCLTLCDPMTHSTPGLPVRHQLLEFTETHVHRVSDAIQPSYLTIKKGGRTGFSRKDKEMSLGKTNGFLEPQTRDEKVCNNV